MCGGLTLWKGFHIYDPLRGQKVTLGFYVFIAYHLLSASSTFT